MHTHADRTSPHEHRLLRQNIGGGSAENPVPTEHAEVIGQTRASLDALKQGIAAPNVSPSPAPGLPSLTVKTAVESIALSGLAAVNLVLIVYVIGGGFYYALTGKNPFPIGRKTTPS